MATCDKYTYKDVDINYIFARRRGFTTNYTGHSKFFETNKWMPTDDADEEFLNKDYLGTSALSGMFASEKPQAAACFLENGSEQPYARVGTCPFPTHSLCAKKSLASSADGVVKDESVELPGFTLYTTPYGCILDQTTQYTYIRYVSKTGIQVSTDASTWVTVPNSVMSNCVMIDLVGGGGGGGSGAVWSNWGKKMNTGGGGSGGAFYSVMVDLARAGAFLALERGIGGEGGGQGGNGDDGWASKIFKGSVVDANEICRAHGGKGGTGGMPDVTGVGGAAISSSTVNSDQRFKASNSTLHKDSNGNIFLAQLGYGGSGAGGNGVYVKNGQYLKGSAGSGWTSAAKYSSPYFKGSWSTNGGAAGGNDSLPSGYSYGMLGGGGGGGASAFGKGDKGGTYIGRGSAGYRGGGGGGCACSGNPDNVNNGHSGYAGSVIIYFEYSPYAFDIMT